MTWLTIAKLVFVGLLLAAIGFLYLDRQTIAAELSAQKADTQKAQADANTAKQAADSWKTQVDQLQAALQQNQRDNQALSDQLDELKSKPDAAPITKYIPVPGDCRMPVAPFVPWGGSVQ